MVVPVPPLDLNPVAPDIAKPPHLRRRGHYLGRQQRQAVRLLASAAELATLGAGAGAAQSLKPKATLAAVAPQHHQFARRAVDSDIAGFALGHIQRGRPTTRALRS